MSQRVADKIKQLILMLDRLDEKVDTILDAKADLSRNVPVFYSQTFSFTQPDLVMQERTIVNGGEDCFLTGISYAVSHSTKSIAPTPNGFMEVSSGPAYFALFDFKWNFRLLSTQAFYGSPANGSMDGDGLLSRQALGYPDRGEPLRWKYPLHFKSGDQIAVRVRPTLWPTFGSGTFGTTNPVRVTLCFVGYRNGVDFASRIAAGDVSADTGGQP